MRERRGRQVRGSLADPGSRGARAAVQQQHIGVGCDRTDRGVEVRAPAHVEVIPPLPRATLQPPEPAGGGLAHGSQARSLTAAKGGPERDGHHEREAVACRDGRGRLDRGAHPEALTRHPDPVDAGHALRVLDDRDNCVGRGPVQAQGSLPSAVAGAGVVHAYRGHTPIAELASGVHPSAVAMRAGHSPADLQQRDESRRIGRHREAGGDRRVAMGHPVGDLEQAHGTPPER
jgi:hypothetical protein